MSQILDEVLAANAAYQADFGDRASLSALPARRFAILTCMDARLDPAHFAGLREGDAHVIRNAGGRASEDAIRSLVLSHKLLGTQAWFVIHHTGCGLMSINDETVRALLAESLETAVADESGWRNVASGGGSRAGEYMNWLTTLSAANGREDRRTQSCLTRRESPAAVFVLAIVPVGTSTTYWTPRAMRPMRQGRRFASVATTRSCLST